MTPLTPVFDLVLGAGILACAATAVLTRRRPTAVVFFLAFGVLTAVLWARLAAPDVALAEVVLGAGVTGALLMLGTRRRRRGRASARGDGSAVRSTPPRRWARVGVNVTAGVVGAAVAVGIGGVLLGIPGGSAPADEAVHDSLDASGVDHPVTAVLLNFRGYDTLLEVAVLATAAWAARAVARHAPLTDTTPEPAPEPVLLPLTRGLPPVMLLLAGWLLVAGSTRPGGAFQAGALLAAALILLGSAGRLPPPGDGWIRASLAVGVGAFLLVAFATALLGSGWLTLDPEWAGAAILAVEAALTLGIAAALWQIFEVNRHSSATGSSAAVPPVVGGSS